MSVFFPVLKRSRMDGQDTDPPELSASVSGLVARESQGGSVL